METSTSDPQSGPKIDQSIQKLLIRVAAKAGYPSVKAFVIAAAIKEARKILIRERLIRLHHISTDKAIHLKNKIDSLKAT